jgi:cell division protein FtsW (lipid II flippase)
MTNKVELENSTEVPSTFTEPSQGRRTEVVLLVIVNLLVTVLYGLASLGDKGRLPGTLWLFLAIMFALSAMAHLGIRRYAAHASQILLPLAVLLNGIGYVEIARWNPPYAKNQALWAALATAGLVLTLKMVKRIRDLDRFRYISLVVAIVLMLLPFVPGIGLSVSGARLWVHFHSYTFQPVEISKILLAIFFASYFAANRDMLTVGTMSLGRLNLVSPRTLLPIVLAWGFALAVLGLENDVGFAMELFALFVSMLWITTGRRQYLAAGVVFFAVGGYAVTQLFSHVHTRITVWLNPWHHLDIGGLQLIQGWFALSAGGLSGTGLGLGQAGRWVTNTTSDMIFSAVGEELGLFGVAIVLGALLLFVAEGFRIAQRARSEFSRLAAATLSLTIGYQSFFIVAGILRILPLTGITLPFVAYGGSSLISNYILLALLLRISQETVSSDRGGRVRLLNLRELRKER